MAQVVYRFGSTLQLEKLELPDPIEPLVFGMKWGLYTQPFTPAFWKAYLWIHDAECVKKKDRYTAGDIRHETVLCLLGGYGIRAEVAYAYYRKMIAAGFLEHGANPSARALNQLLRTPVAYNGGYCRYRFPNQKARYLAGALARLSADKPPVDDLRLRDWLLQLPGVGRKTAGWIVRNCLGSDNVAIIDVHLQRAGRQMKLFDSRVLCAATYAYFEHRFLDFARAIKVRASVLDLLMWETMRQFPSPARLPGR